MSDQHDLLDLPILDELGGDLARAFRAAEAPSSRARRTAATLPAAAASPPRRRYGRRRRWATASVATVLAMGAAAALLPGDDPGGLGVDDAAAAGLLRRAAHLADGTNASAMPRKEQYAYSDVLSLASVINAEATSGKTIRDSTTFVLGRRRTWSSAGRPGVAIQRTLAETSPGAPPPAMVVDPDDPEGDTGRPSTTATPRLPGERLADGSVRAPLGRARYTLGGEQLSPAQLLAFPTDPKAILARLRRTTAGRGPSPDGEVWAVINDALRDLPLPRALAAGLYRALALLPGVTVDGVITDRLGRRATRIGYQEPGTWERVTLLLDPRTSRRLGDQIVIAPTAVPRPSGEPSDGRPLNLPPSPYPAGTVIAETLVLRSGVTNRIGGPLVAR